MEHQVAQTEPLSPRTILLREAEKIVTKDRNSAYGNPEDNFRDIAELWTAYWRGRIGAFTPMDVAMMNSLIKIARLKKNPGHRDSLVDVAGYAACGADIQAGMQKKLGPQTGHTQETIEEIIRQQSAITSAKYGQGQT